MCVLSLVTESGAVLGGRLDLLHHPAWAVLGGYGSICRGEVTQPGAKATVNLKMYQHTGWCMKYSVYDTSSKKVCGFIGPRDLMQCSELL